MNNMSMALMKKKLHSKGAKGKVKKNLVASMHAKQWDKAKGGLVEKMGWGGLFGQDASGNDLTFGQVNQQERDANTASMGKNGYGALGAAMGGLGVAGTLVDQNSDDSSLGSVYGKAFGYAGQGYSTLSKFGPLGGAIGAVGGFAVGAVKGSQDFMTPLYAGTSHNLSQKQQLASDKQVAANQVMSAAKGGKVPDDKPRMIPEVTKKANIKYVSSKNDPAYKVYRDSLNLYNKSVDAIIDQDRVKRYNERIMSGHGIIRDQDFVEYGKRAKFVSDKIEPPMSREEAEAFIKKDIKKELTPKQKQQLLKTGTYINPFTYKDEFNGKVETWDAEYQPASKTIDRGKKIAPHSVSGAWDTMWGFGVELPGYDNSYNDNFGNNVRAYYKEPEQKVVVGKDPNLVESTVPVTQTPPVKQSTNKTYTPSGSKWTYYNDSDQWVDQTSGKKMDRTTYEKTYPNQLRQANYDKFPMGGMVQQPNVEVEKQEVAQQPNGEMQTFDLPSHEQATTRNQVALEPGTRIFSDRLKTLQSKKAKATFADEADALRKQIERYEQILYS